ncbi:MAG: PoNe immunity protein domain-containing protein [Bacteroidota bacterium]
MRDRIKDEKYFKDYLNESYRLLNKRIDKFSNGLIRPEREKIVKIDMGRQYLKNIFAKYSLGLLCSDYEEDYINGLVLIEKYWAGSWKIDDEHVELNQYSLGAYYDLLCMLSLGYLLKYSNEWFERLKKVIEEDKVEDLLYNFILASKLSESNFLLEESYQKYFAIPEVFKSLREAIIEEDTIVAQSLIKQFIEKEWYQNHKEVDSGWVNNHLSEHNLYVGYWCFEAAAITCIKGLDDSSYRDHPYYPKDLADYYRANR